MEGAVDQVGRLLEVMGPAIEHGARRELNGRAVE